MERRTVLSFGIFFLLMETAKQLYLYFSVFGCYNVWYFPFQMCSMPIYLCLLYGVTGLNSNTKSAVLAFLMDYGMLGGALSIIYHEGFTFPGHPLLTAHGYIWHSAMVLLSVLIFTKCRKNNPDDAAREGGPALSRKGFVDATKLFLLLAACAFIIDLALHRFGDCDMFYISPYHLSTQPVFRSIDAAVGRLPGILIYLASVIVGAGIVHLAYHALSRRRSS